MMNEALPFFINAVFVGWERLLYVATAPIVSVALIVAVILPEALALWVSAAFE